MQRHTQRPQQQSYLHHFTLGRWCFHGDPALWLALSEPRESGNILCKLRNCYLTTVLFVILISSQFTSSVSVLLICWACKTLVHFVRLQNYHVVSHSFWKWKRGRTECKGTNKQIQQHTRAAEGREKGRKEEKTQRWLVQSEAEVVDANTPPRCWNQRQESRSKIRRMQIPAGWLHPDCVLALPPLALESRWWCSFHTQRCKKKKFVLNIVCFPALLPVVTKRFARTSADCHILSR